MEDNLPDATFITDFHGHIFSFAVPNAAGEDAVATCEKALDQVREGKNLNTDEYPNKFVKAMNPELLEHVQPYLEEFYGLREIQPTEGNVPMVSVPEDFLVALVHAQLQPTPPYLNQPNYIHVLQDIFHGQGISEKAAQAANFILHKARVLRGQDNAELSDTP